MSSKVGAQHLFIGPGSDQSTLVTISDSLTDSVVVAVNVVTVAEKRVNGKLEADVCKPNLVMFRKLIFCSEHNVWLGFRNLSSGKILKLMFGFDF